MPSPPRSALRLSRVDSPPDQSSDTESSRTATPPPRPPTAGTSVPAIDTIPDMPDSQSKSSRPTGIQLSNPLQKAIPVQVFRTAPAPRLINPPVNKPLPHLPPPSEPRYSIAESEETTEEISEPPRRSKLSMLASSRAATSRVSTFTKSSRVSVGTVGTSSVLTYPALRPSSESELSFSPEDETVSSATSSIVRRAIQTALYQEAVDRTASPQGKVDKEVQHTGSEAKSSSSKSTLRADNSPKERLSTSETATSYKTPASVSKESSAYKTAGSTSKESILKDSVSKEPSKLARLAQSKGKQTPWSPKPKHLRSPSPHSLLHTTHTEYLTPIANGPTATTAITTSYQSLNHLQSPARSALPPSYPPPSSTPTSSPEPRQSKLAMKAKKAKVSPQDDRAYLPVPVPAIFVPESGRSRASPSTFASLLIERVPLTSLEDKGERREKRDKPDRSSKERHRSRSRSRSRAHPHTSKEHKSPSSAEEAAKPRRSSSKTKARSAKPTPPLAPLGPFAFDVPSPDDIVFNARKGTALGRSGASTPTAFPPSTVSSRSATSSISAFRVAT
ncbi:hypothetical protein BV25DRAFT_1818114 [Artomyces pyxidatus]|uniref:Uncharacterized protein n=1 Tax=Artomyces pyxidatus TaxID=48021 RepID=A0ACB8TL14_9AGAM|nr:hypothetical protein BV25DRAFT_1818114 [Artomyces pyxidatus]